MELVLTPERLAAVLCVDTDRSLEQYPQPFRLQDQLTILIPYQSYVVFINDYVGNPAYLYTREQEMLNRYYMDIARAVAKECYFAVQYDASPTHIRHVFEKPNAKCPAFDLRAQSERFSTYMDGLGFGCAVLPAIKTEWEYACAVSNSGISPAPTQWNP